jgi:hypothetical protein
MENDEAYFARRAEEERAAAERSDDPYAQDVHLRMAAAYELRMASARSSAERTPGASATVIRIRPNLR